MADTPLLSVEGLRVTFAGERGAVRAIDGIDLEVSAGQTLGIVGESGSGKSVTAKTIMNLLPRTATVTGKIELDGTDVLNLDPKKDKHFFGVKAAMVFQDPMTSLNPVKKVGVQLTESMRYHLNTSKSDSRTRAIELLDKVGIPEPAKRLKQYPHELSGGMRQRVVIAMSLACDPQLLIADEPTTALDVTVQKRILDLLDDLRRDSNMAMILITHDLGVVRGRSDEIAVMYGGRIMETGPAEAIFAGMRHPYTEALMESIPRVDQPSHTRLTPIPGRPPDLVNPPVGCRFASRCRSAQESCITDPPELRDGGGLQHQYACHFPVGTPEGDEARATNLAAGTTATGLDIEHLEAEIT
jgi:peptide/nickel transport system ATP-binding protein